MLKNWFVAQNKFTSFKGRIWFIPCISIWYDKNTFLETGVVTPAFGIQIAWLGWVYSFMLQKGY
jgi:hypothetical protein